MKSPENLFQKSIPILMTLLLAGFIVQSLLLYRLTRNEASPPPPPKEKSTPAEAPVLQSAPRLPTAPPPTHWGQEDWNPFEEMNRMREEMDAMFGRFFGGMNRRPEFDPFPRAMVPRQPRMDIRETQDAYHISLEFPGAGQAEIETEVRQGHLHVSARLTLNTEPDQQDGRLMHTERYESRFHRVIPLPGDADPGAISSTYENGVLHLTLPRRQLSRRDTI